VITAAEVIRASVENAGPDMRRAVQAAVAMTVEHGLEREVLRVLESRPNEGARWLRAALTETVEGPKAAAPHWQAAVTQSGCEIPEALLHRARAAAREGDRHRAAVLLRLALQGTPDYDFFLRAETLVRKCKPAFGCQRKIKIALLGSSTTALLRGVMESLCLRDKLEAEFYEPPFGAYMQELLQPDSELRTFGPEFIVLLLNWRDLGLPNVCENGRASDAVSRVTEAWQAAMDHTSAHIIQPTFVPPAQDAYHVLSSVMSTGRARAIGRINETLLEFAPGRVTLIDSQRIAASTGGPWEDPITWSSAKIYPAPGVLPSVAEHLVSCIRAELGLSRKLLILDLDNTLWGGVVGEDGPDGIRLGPPSAVGERYQEFQRYVKGLGQRGVLLAVASKNNPEDAAEVFRRHQGGVLRLEDFVSFKANWLDKPNTIRQMASELRLGLDSFVFLDDSPAERNAVRQELPEVVVPEISGEPSESIAALERGLYFQAIRLTGEDVARSASYLASAQQEQLRERSGSLDQYLSDLCMRIEHGPVSAATSLRVTQLINKTNQFNLTSRRYTEEEVQRRMVPDNCWFRWYRLRDRFADHGLIGVLLADMLDREWTVDLWLMSCRVIGRGVETFMFRDMVDCARRSGAQRLRAHYIATAKNKLVENLLPRFGFVATANEGEFVLELAVAAVPECTFLQGEIAQVGVSAGVGAS
jgi:FkbH-like protein